MSSVHDDGATVGMHSEAIATAYVAESGGSVPVHWFDDVSRRDIPLVGGKGANLGEMTRAGLPIPPGFVIDVEAYAQFRTQTGLGPRIEHHPAFPNRVNVEFVEVVARDRVRQRTWERGAGETLACGTGACAAAVAGILRGLLDSPVAVEARGGTLTVSWAGGDNAVWMKGPAKSVFEGEVEL